MKYNLHIKHKSFKSHNEYWTVKNNKVNVLSICPKNSPSTSEITFTKSEALRQFALLMVEGWQVVNSDNIWHNYIEQE